MDAIKEIFFAAGVPAIISTGITILYLLLKAYQFAVYAVPHQTERRLAETTPSGCHQVNSATEGDQSRQEVFEQIPTDISAEYGTKFKQPRTVPLPRGRENIRVNPRRNDEKHSSQPVIRTDAKRLQSRGSTDTRDNNGQRSSGPYDDAAGVFDESGRWSDAENDQPRRYGRTGSQERSNATVNDGISGRRDPEEKQVSDASLQTDTCDTLYVTKNTLTAYTIAIIQNSQVSQYDQMHAALQSARNQASLKTPLKAEELLSAHFNLAVLEGQSIGHTNLDAEKSPDSTQNAEPTTSAPDDQTYIKIPSRYAENTATRRTHPTGAVTPTCRPRLRTGQRDTCRV